ncbi:hypothetical protein P7D63_08700 [Enterococcus raffinosus]|uniref:hypothetical protein n=1 Tax=Enterococcus raffinosus TaxID=71452 RepID=UPI00288EEDC7|nr:hypothetical protein [Enterococcus raffinosus]MDT2554756.1 hypothetical protein [Enterococcus raffinosus]
MTIKDSLGVPLEPEYEKPILKDYYGDPIYLSSAVFGLVLIYDVTEYEIKKPAEGAD